MKVFRLIILLLINVKNSFLRRIIICNSGIQFSLNTGIFQTDGSLLGWLEWCC